MLISPKLIQVVPKCSQMFPIFVAEILALVSFSVLYLWYEHWLVKKKNDCYQWDCLMISSLYHTIYSIIDVKKNTMKCVHTYICIYDIYIYMYCTSAMIPPSLSISHVCICIYVCIKSYTHVYIYIHTCITILI